MGLNIRQAKQSYSKNQVQPRPISELEQINLSNDIVCLNNDFLEESNVRG